MNKILNSLIETCSIISLFMCMFACAQDEKDLFEKSAAERLNESASKYQELLEASEYGWALEFYLGDESTPTSYVSTVRFYDGNVDMVSEMVLSEDHIAISLDEPTYETLTSKYSVKAEQSIVLSFDTYALPIHYYSEPFKDVFGAVPNGYGGDFEFCFLKTSIDQDTIYLRGKRFYRDVRLVRIHEDGSSYIKKVYKMKDLSIFDMGTMQFGDKSYVIDIYRKRLVIELDHEKQVAESHFFVYTNNGFRLLNPVEFNGCWLESFTFDWDTGVLISQDGKAVAHFPTPWEQIANTKLDWYIKNTDKSANFEEKYTSISRHMLMPPRFPLPQIFIGMMIGRDYSFGILDKVICFNFRWYRPGRYGHIKESYKIRMEINESNNTISFIPVEPGGGWGNYSYPDNNAPMINDEMAYIDEIVKYNPYRVEFDMEGIKIKEAKLISISNENIYFTLEERELNDNILGLK